MRGYRLRLAASPQEDLAAIRLFGNGIYGFDLEALNKLKTRADLAKAGMRMALREGHTVVLDHDGEVVGAARITPSPWGTRDPETGEIEHWETVAIHPNHRGKGLSTPLRAAALKTATARVIKSRIKNGNPRSWGVAEKLGFKHDDDDGDERVYVMRRDPPALQSRGSAITSGTAMKKTAAPKFLESTIRDAARWAQNKMTTPQPGSTDWGDVAGQFWHNHGGKVMGGLGGIAAGALGNAVMPKAAKKKIPGWLLPLLAGVAGVAGGHYLSDRMAKTAGVPVSTAPKAVPQSPRVATPLARDARPGGPVPNNANMTKVALIAKIAFENPLGGVDWSKLWADHKGKIIGGLGGAALGGLGGAMMNGEDDEGESHGVRNGVLGALAGLGLGAGGGYLYDDPEAMAKLKGLIGLGDDTPTAATAPQGSNIPGAAGGGAAGAAAAMGLRHLRGKRPGIAEARTMKGQPWFRAPQGRSKMHNIGRLLGYGAIPAAGAYAGSRF